MQMEHPPIYAVVKLSILKGHMRDLTLWRRRSKSVVLTDQELAYEKKKRMESK